MKLTIRKLLSSLLACAFLVGVTPGEARADPALLPVTGVLHQILKQEAENIYYNMSTSQFQAVRDAQNPWQQQFDWTTDGCSTPVFANILLPQEMRYARNIFRNHCEMHDFAGANFGPQGRLKLDPTQSRKSSIDDRFHGLMREKCRSRPLVERPYCYSVAGLVVVAVRTQRW